MKVYNKPIDVIAKFDKEGNITPVKFQLTQNDKNYVYKVSSIFKTQTFKFMGKDVTSFDCKCIVNGKERVCQIRYLHSGSRWVLYKV